MIDTIGPAYKRVADDLRAQVTRGDLKIGESIPSTQRLMEQYGVSNTVARHAVQVLRDEGLVRGQAGKAVYVIATPQEITQERLSLDSLHAQFDDLTTELQAIAARVPADLTERLEALSGKVGLVETQLLELYGRLGQPYPRDTATSERHRRTGS